MASTLPIKPRTQSQNSLKTFWIATAVPIFLLECLFLGNLAYVYGIFFGEAHRGTAMNTLFVDYDNGSIGQTIWSAYQSLQANTFPELQQQQSAKYTSSADIRKAVCKGDYWAALYTHVNASKRLASAVQGGERAATYDAEDTVTYIYNQARYPALSDSIIQANVQTLMSVARSIYGTANTSWVMENVNFSDPQALQAYYNPFQAKSDLLQPTTQGSRVFYNTISMVMPILMQFFFLMATNGISTDFGIPLRMSRIGFFLQRLAISQIYQILGSLAMVGYIWAFREDWNVSGGKFAESWLLLWLYMDINYVVLDSVMDTVIPVKFMPFLMLTWIITNVASTITPFELSAGFYRWGYALPAHETYTLLVGIWSDCPYELHTALPILLSWWLVGHITSFLACITRHKQARKMGMEIEEMDDLSILHTQRN